MNSDWIVPDLTDSSNACAAETAWASIDKYRSVFRRNDALTVRMRIVVGSRCSYATPIFVASRKQAEYPELIPSPAARGSMTREL